MTDFLLELRSEEIPARMQAGARADLEKLFRKELASAGLTPGAITVWSTPRRLALIARDLPEATEAVSEEVKGPRTSAPEQALEGFLRKTGLAKEQLTDRDGVWFAVSEKPGRATRAVLAEAIPAVVRAFPWPKSMRWGASSISTESTRWVRPLSGIVAIFGEDLVKCEAGGFASGYATRGHRFHCPGEITIGSAADYQEKLRACHVIVDHEERQDLIRSKARAAAEAAGLALVEDEGLVIENAGLTEWPVPLLGRFDEAYLEVPPEVIQLTARTNQKYFVCTYPPRTGEGDHPQDGGGAPTVNATLANAFVCTANIEAADGGEAIVAGNRKVLAARLSDARFFWEQDRKTSLADHATKLERITFHEKLGTVADKVERVAKLARWLVEEGIVTASPLPQAGGAGGGPSSESPAPAGIPTPNPSRLREGNDVAQLADLAEQAARLCKADLVTEMVGEFPELQGLMGGYYARAEGLPDAVADAIRDHYKPVGQGDEVPTAPVTVAVSLADKLDTLVGFFAVGERPTGSKDPFALRRAAYGVIMALVRNGIRLPLESCVHIALMPLVMDYTNRVTVALWVAMGQSDLKKDVQKRLEDQSAVEKLLREIDEFTPEIDRAATGVDVLNRLTACLRDGQLGGEINMFFADRLKVQQREAGVRHDLIDAVFALGGEDDLVRLLARVHALQAFVGTEDGTNLLAGYKRAANILKKEGYAAQNAGAEGEGTVPPTGEEDPLSLVDDPAFADVAAEFSHGNGHSPRSLPYTPDPAEADLIAALAGAAPLAEQAVAAEDFAGAMAALATLRGPIDAFFDGVTVNDADPEKRAARLALLDQFRAAVHKVADFSRIEG